VFQSGWSGANKLLDTAYRRQTRLAACWVTKELNASSEAKTNWNGANMFKMIDKKEN
jgi:hypothetical protein